MEQDVLLNATYLDHYRALGLRQEVTAQRVDALARQMLIEARLRARESRVDEAVQRNNTGQAKLGEAEELEIALGKVSNVKG